MNRRQVLGGAALLGVAGLAGGYWSLPRSASAGAVALDAAQRLLDSLVGHELVAIEGWAPAAVFNHCAQSIEYSLDGFPQLKAEWFRSSIGPLAFSVFSSRGAMRHSLQEPIPGAAGLDQPSSQASALERLRGAFARFAAHQGPLQPHFAYGALSHGEYAQAHVMHLYEHLSLLRPA
jgi:hypothetical protein